MDKLGRHNLEQCPRCNGLYKREKGHDCPRLKKVVYSCMKCGASVAEGEIHHCLPPDVERCSMCKVLFRQGENHKCLPPKRFSHKQKQDGTTWMVSVITGGSNLSCYPMDHAGSTTFEAANGYLNDPDNLGADALRADDTAILCVIGQELHASGKQWKVALYCLEDGKLRSFP